MDLTRLAQRFLRELHSEPSKNTFSALRELLEKLENKGDPEPTEVRLIEEINNFLESVGVLESHLKSYIKDDVLLGSKLETLYENDSLDGSRNLKG